MPQTDISTFVSQLFWLAMALGVLFMWVRVVFLPAVMGSVQQREGHIQEVLAEAARLTEAANEAKLHREQQLLAARAATEALLQHALLEARARSEAALQQLDAQLTHRLLESERRMVTLRSEAPLWLRAVTESCAQALGERVTAVTEGKALTIVPEALRRHVEAAESAAR